MLRFEVIDLTEVVKNQHYRAHLRCRITGDDVFVPVDYSTWGRLTAIKANGDIAKIQFSS